MKTTNWRRILSLMLISLMVLTAMPTQALASAQAQDAEAAQPAQAAVEGDALAEATEAPLLEITEEQKAWVLAQYGLTGEEDFLNDAFFMQYVDAYQSYLQGQDTSADGAQESANAGSEPGPAPVAKPTQDPLNLGIGGATEGDFFIDEDDDLVIGGGVDKLPAGPEVELPMGGMDEEDELAGMGESEDQEAKETKDEESEEAEDKEAKETEDEESEAAEDEEAKETEGEESEGAEDEEVKETEDEESKELDKLPLADEGDASAVEEEELTEEELEGLDGEELGEELLDEEELPEEAAEEETGYRMAVEPSGATFMATGEEIKPTFRVLDAEDNVVSSYPGDAAGWEWGGDLSAVEIGEYRASASFGDASVSANWTIEEHVFTGMLFNSMLLSARAPVFKISDYTGEVQALLDRIPNHLTSRNFGTRLSNLAAAAIKAIGNDNMGNAWTPSVFAEVDDPPVALSFSEWYATDSYIWPKAEGLLVWGQNSKVFTYQARAQMGDAFSFDGFSIGEGIGSKVWLLPIKVTYTPQPYTVHYAGKVSIMYGQNVPAITAFHNPIVDGVEQSENMADDVIKGLDAGDKPSGALTFSWNSSECTPGGSSEHLEVGKTYDRLLELNNSRDTYYRPVLNAKSNKTDTPQFGGELTVTAVPVENTWVLPASEYYTGSAFVESVDLTATAAARSTLGLGAGKKLPFTHTNYELGTTITVTKTTANGTTTETIDGTRSADKVSMTDVGKYVIKVRINNGNYMFANGTSELVKNFEIKPIPVKPALDPNSHIFSSSVSYSASDLEVIDTNSKTPDVTVTSTVMPSRVFVPRIDYKVSKIEGKAATNAGNNVLRNIGKYDVTVELIDSNYYFETGSGYTVSSNGKSAVLNYTISDRVLTVQWVMGPTFVYGTDLPHPINAPDKVAIVKDQDGNKLIPQTDYTFKYYGPTGAPINFDDIKNVDAYTVKVELVDKVNNRFKDGTIDYHNFTITPLPIPAPWKNDAFVFGTKSKLYKMSSIPEADVLSKNSAFLNVLAADLNGWLRNAPTGYKFSVIGPKGTLLNTDSVTSVGVYTVKVEINNTNYCFDRASSKTQSTVVAGTYPMVATFTIEVMKRQIDVDDKTKDEYEYGEVPDELVDVHNEDPDGKPVGPGDYDVDIKGPDGDKVGEPGDYVVTIDLTDEDNDEFTDDAETVIKFTIKPRSIPAPWGNDSFVYASPSPVYKLSSIPKPLVVDKTKDFGYIRSDKTPYILAKDWNNWVVGSSNGYTFTVEKEGVRLAETDNIENKGIYNVTVTINSKYYRFNKTLPESKATVSGDGKTATFKIVVLPRIADAERIIEERYEVTTIPPIFVTPEDLVNVTDITGVNPFPGDYTVTLYDKDNNKISVEDANNTPGNYCVTVELLNPNDEFTDGSTEVSFRFTVYDPNAGDGDGDGDGDGGDGGNGDNGGGDGDHEDHLLHPLGEVPEYPLSYLPEGPVGELQAIIDDMNGDDIRWLTYHENEKAGWTVFEQRNIIAYLGDEGGNRYKVLKAIDVSEYYGNERNYVTDLLTVIPAEDGRVLMAAVWDTDLNRTSQNMLLIDPLAMELVTMNNTVNCSWLDLSLNGMYTSFFVQEELVTIDIPNAYIVRNTENIGTVAYMLDEHLLEYVSNAQATMLDTTKFARYVNSFSWGSYPLAQATNEGVLVRVVDGVQQGDHLLTASTADQSVLQERYLLTSKVEKQGFYRWLEKQPRQSSTMYAANYLD